MIEIEMLFVIFYKEKRSLKYKKLVLIKEYYRINQLLERNFKDLNKKNDSFVVFDLV